jgi:transaldolase
MKNSTALKIKVFCDAADLNEIIRAYRDGLADGFTTNPTLMRKAGVVSYETFAKQALDHIRDAPISFEVFADELDQMEEQAHEISKWGPNVYVKIPAMNTRGESAVPLVERLSAADIKVNVTAVLSLQQVEEVASALRFPTPSIVSVFAGRIADTGRDPVPVMRQALTILRPCRNTELLWASPREVLNIYQANEIGCHIITATPGILAKLTLGGKDLRAYSLETVKMFYEDAVAAGYHIDIPAYAHHG